MSYKNLKIKPSGIEGYGLYANEYIKKGEIIMCWTAAAYLIPEAEYNRRQSNGDQQIITTGTRYVESVFLYTDTGPDKDRYENYINHSFTPNVLYHCGICFALSDINIDDELTTDYTYLLSEADQESFIDAKTNKPVAGVPWHTCLLKTTEMLTQILKSMPTIPYTSTPSIPSTPCPAPAKKTERQLDIYIKKIHSG